LVGESVVESAGAVEKPKDGFPTAPWTFGPHFPQRRLLRSFLKHNFPSTPHLASDDDVEVNAQTLRRWMLAEGLWSRARKRRLHRKRRERKQHVGELVQMDGSFHDWLEERGPRGCLMNMVDDASGDTLAQMGSEETIWAAAGVLRAWVKKYGVPVALYTDWKNVYVREASTKEQLQGVVPVTQFGQMCQRLGLASWPPIRHKRRVGWRETMAPTRIAW
jgi:hypothetical protein